MRFRKFWMEPKTWHEGVNIEQNKLFLSTTKWSSKKLKMWGKKNFIHNWKWKLTHEECRPLGCYVMWLLLTDISEKCSAFIIRVTRISELGTMLAVTSNWCTLQRNTMREPRATQCNIPENGILHSHCHENLKSYKTYPLPIFFYEHSLVVLMTEFLLPQRKDHLKICLFISHE
jgi:hypothetical protein